MESLGDAIVWIPKVATSLQKVILIIQDIPVFEDMEEGDSEDKT